MKNGILRSAIVLSLCATGASADDIEIYFSKSADGAPYVHIMVDSRPSTNSTLCTMDAPSAAVTQFESSMLAAKGGNGNGNSGGDDSDDGSGGCSTAMSAEAFAHLQSLPADVGYAVGDQVDLIGGFKAVIAAVLSNSAFTGINVALIGVNDKANSSGKGGGTILQGYKSLGDTVKRDLLLADIKGLPRISGNTAIDWQPREATFEWFRYINGGNVAAGMDTGGNWGMATPFPDYDPTIISGNKYISPFEGGDCPKLYSIMVTMNSDNQDTNYNTEITTEMKPAGDSTDLGSNKFPPLLDYIHKPTTDLFLAHDDPPSVAAYLQKSWVIGDGKSQGQTAKYLTGAEIGTDEELLLTDAVQLETDLTNAFKEIISVSSSFVSASVPVNVFNQTESLDNVFIALFEARDSIDWPGNVKKLKLTDDPTDADDAFDAIEDNSIPQQLYGFEVTGDDRGRIRFDALTYWTDPSTLPDPDADDFPGDSALTPSGKDGRVVDRGGAGQKVPGVIQDDTTNYNYIIGDHNADTGGATAVARKVFLEAASILDPSSNTNLVDFAATGDDELASDTTIQQLLDPDGVGVTEAEAIELIKWGRGQDTDNNSAAARFWVLGDAIHSRPFALNYGDSDGGGDTGFDPNNPDIRVMFGAGDGMFHLLQNTEPDTGDDTYAGGQKGGRESFAYIPREMLAQIKRRKTSTSMDAGTDMRYGIDGAPVVLTLDANTDLSLTADSSGDEAYVFFGMRRGGYSYHALDIIDPDDPRLQWKITQTRTDGSSSDFDELGLTFSTPVVGKAKYDDTDVDVLVFGGGYHGGWDPNDPTATSQFGKDISANEDAFGNAIYMVNARTGALIWKVIKGNTNSATKTGSAVTYTHTEMAHSIPSDLTVIKDDAGYINKIYVGDTGGSIWRVDTPDGSCTGGSGCDQRQENWFVTRLADMAPNGEDVRFFHKPDIILATDSDGDAFDGVIIQSGNRADPLDIRFTSPIPTNYLFYIRDYHILAGDTSVKTPEDGNAAEVPQYDIDDLADRTGCTGSEAGTASSTCEPVGNPGWKIQYGTSEKGLSTPLVDAGRIFATTYSPGADGVCGVPGEGNGNLFVVGTADGAPLPGKNRSFPLGPGIPSDPVVIGDVIWLPGGGPLEDLDGDGVDDTVLTKSFTQKILPIYWREPGVDELK